MFNSTDKIFNTAKKEVFVFGYLSDLYAFLFSRFLSSFYELGNIQGFDRPALSLVLFIVFLVIVTVSLVGRKSPGLGYDGDGLGLHEGENIFAGPIKLLMKSSFILFSAFLFLAIADPYEEGVETIKEHESRVRIEILDVSASMCFEHGSSGKPLGEIARRGHLKFLNMRAGKGDITAFFVFSFYPYLIQDFISDDRAYMFQVYNTPFATTSYNNFLSLRMGGYVRCDNDDVRFVEDEGGTDLALGLRRIINHYLAYIEEFSEAKVSLLMITDAAVESFPGDELAKIQELEIVPYILYIPPNEAAERRHIANPEQRLEFSERLKREIEMYGGKYFYADSEDDILEAYEEIDRTQPVVFREYIEQDKNRLAFHAVLLSIVFFATFLFFATLYSIFWYKHP